MSRRRSARSSRTSTPSTRTSSRSAPRRTRGPSAPTRPAASAKRSRRVVEEATGRAPRELRLYRTEDGLVIFLTLAVGPDEELARAHAYASEIERRLREALPDIAEVIVHTEP